MERLYDTLVLIPAYLFIGIIGFFFFITWGWPVLSLLLNLFGFSVDPYLFGYPVDAP